MNIPKLDHRRESDLMREIRMLAESFTPEWICRAEEPDLGFAAAQLFGEMMEETIEKYNRTAEKNMIEFFAQMGADRKYSEPAKGYVQLQIAGSASNVPGERLKKGTVLSAVSGDGQRIGFSTEGEVYVCNTTIADIFCEDAIQDQIFCLCTENESSTVPRLRTYPKAEEGLQKHLLYFSSEAVEYLAEKTRVRLKFQLDKAGEALTDRFYHAVQQGLFYGTEKGFVRCEAVTCVGEEIQFSFGEEKPVKQILHGLERYWFLIRLSDADELSKVYLDGILLGTEGGHIPPDGIFGDYAELTAYRFCPFDLAPIPYSAVYFACDAALCRKGSAVTLEFRLDYSRNPIHDMEADDIDWKHIMKKSQLRKPTEYEVRIQNVIWEYWNGSGWIKLFRDNSYGDVFSGANDKSIVRISFPCPADMMAALLPSGEHFAIRARIVSVENYMKQNGYYITPEISSPTFSYVYHQLPAADYMVTENCLEKKQFPLPAEHAVRACYASSNHGVSLYFGFTAAPEYAGIQLLFVCEHNEIHANRGFVWEYFDGAWKNLSCWDETRGLSQTGLLTLNRNVGFVQTTLFGKEHFWIRLRFLNGESFPKKSLTKICLNCVKLKNVEYCEPEYFYVSRDDGWVCTLTGSHVYQARVWVNQKSEISAVTAETMIRNGQAKPVYRDNEELAQLWVEWNEWQHTESRNCYQLDRENAQVIFDETLGKLPPESDGENVMISYTVCNGQAGNLPAGTVFAFESSAGLITSAVAPLPLTGGLDRESLHDTLNRSAEELRTFSRICSEADYGGAVRRVERNVICVRTLGGQNPRGEKEHGAVTLVVLLRDMDAFPEKSGKIRKYLISHCCANVRPEKLWIIPPCPIYCTVAAEAYTESYDTVGDLEWHIRNTINAYFDFQTGNDGIGWEIGSVPDGTVLYEQIAGVPGVTGISGFYLHMTDEQGNEIHETELSGFARLGMCIPMLREIHLEIKVM